jgi:hypothetical protein
LGRARGICRSAHVVVKRRGGGRDHKAGGHAVCAQTKACYRWRACGHGVSTPMPRYYFHITNGQESLDNPKGMDLPGNATARQEAVVLASELRHGKVMPGRSWEGWFVTVVDQHGHQVDSVPIADMPDE